ncbi:MAG: M23 family metallopeptidase [Clostridia bacterium]|nr:M23 family metallopeptidase [Clostridia bacterium]
MDRLISEEERIRRAEDILERRRNTDLRISSQNFVKEKNNTKIRNMLIQILICLLIYCGIYYVKNSKNENLKGFVANVNSILEYDVDFKKIYQELCKKYESLNLNNANRKSNNSQNNNGEASKQSNGDPNNSGSTTNNNGGVYDPNNSDSNEDSLNQSNNTGNGETSAENTSEANSQLTKQENNNSENQTTEEELQKQSEELSMGIGGSTEDIAEQTSNVLTEEEQMKVDAEYIKTNFNIINPLSKGIVTSRFGVRDSSEIVSANHKGIDLGATTGTTIIGAMEGTVIEASSKGDFGLHLKVANGDITLIYAHCSELLVKEGDKINQGDEIAKVGSTGKATGPHLHFEIRRENRAINPEYLLQF